MKQMKQWLKLAALAALFLASACTSAKEPQPSNDSTPHPDAIRFHADYTSLNGQKNSSGKTYMTMDIREDNAFRYSSFEEINELIRSGTGVIFLGFPECPWCRNAVPVLDDVAEEENIKEILYLNVRELRDVKKLDEKGNVVTESEGAEGYTEFVELMYDWLDEYEGLNDPTIKRLYVPAVIFVKEGVVQAVHVGTVESQEDPYVPLTKEQYKELYDIYAEATVKTLREVCTTEAKSC